MSLEAIDPPPRRGSTAPAGRVLLVGLLGLVLGALLNADSLVTQAERKPFGWPRDLSLAIWTPAAHASRLLHLDRPRMWLDGLTNRSGEPAAAAVAVPQVPAQVPVPASPPTTEEPEPDPGLRTPGPGDPLRVWVGGDSMSQVFGQSLVGVVADTGVMTSTLDYRISTGLTRPDYFDWPAHLAGELERLDPEAVVIMFGANDAQGLVDDGGEVHSLLSDGWVAQYRSRVALVMELLRAPGRMVYWVGQPVMRSATFSGRMAALNLVYEEEAESRPWVRFVDSYALFSDAGGGYQAFLEGLDGRPQEMRQNDGIHLSRAGGDLLARQVLDLILLDAGLP